MNVDILKNISNITIGYHFSRSAGIGSSGSHYIIRGTDFAGSFVFDHTKLSKFHPEKNVEKYYIRKNDILFQSKGSYIGASYVSDVFDKTVAASNFYIIRITDKNVIPEYVVWWLNSRYSQKYFQQHRALGSLIQYVSRKQAEHLEIKIPAIEIQQKIKDFVQLSEHEINCFEQLIALKKKLYEELSLKFLENE